MNALLIMHEVCMLAAEGFIIWSVLKVHRKTDPLWFKKHPILAFIGIIFVLCSFGFIFAFKEVHAYPHFTSLHATMGVITIFLLLSNLSVGFAMAKSWGKLKTIHRRLGKITAFFVVTTALAGIVRFIEILKT